MASARSNPVGRAIATFRAMPVTARGRLDGADLESWAVETGEVSELTANDVYAFAVSSGGRLASSRFDDHGPTPVVRASAI